MTKVKWVDELPGKPPESRRRTYRPRGDSRDLWAHAAELVKQPLRWSVYPRPLTERAAKAAASRIAEGSLAAYDPDLGFEAAYRQGALYVRHNPAFANPVQVAYDQGYREGKKRVIDQVRKAVWQFRLDLSDIEGTS